MSQNTKPQPDDLGLQSFKKNIVAHLIVLQSYSSLQLQSDRIEFHRPLNAGDIEILVASLRHELLRIFTGENLSTDDMPENLPCPFCGDQPKKFIRFTDGEFSSVGCDNYAKCKVKPTAPAANEEEAYKIWNQRA